MGHLLHAHLEAHDHLAVAFDRPDGSIELIGPASRADEILAVAREIARAVGLLFISDGETRRPGAWSRWYGAAHGEKRLRARCGAREGG